MNKNVLITGTDKGLGLALVAHFLREGYQVFAGHVGDGAALKQLSPSFPNRLVTVPQDVSDMGSILRSAELVRQHTDYLDILINSAGICLDVFKPLSELDLSNGAMEKMMAVNAFGPLRVTQTFLPLLERGQRKQIANISSEAGSIGENWRDVGYGYCMTKAALNRQSQILQKWLKPKKIKVFLFHPGWLRTDMGGPDATVTPEVSAAGIYNLLHQTWTLDDPMYMDYTGRLFQW